MNISLFRRRLPKRALFGTVSLLALTVASVGVSTPEAFADAYINHGDTKTVSGDAPDSPWDVPGALFIGDNEDGTLNIINGGTVTSVSGYVGISFSGGPDLTGEGTVTVDGAGSTWTNFSLDIDNGSVSVTNGGTIVTNGMLSLIGMHAGKSGLVRVDGPGSTWTSLDLTVGERGAGQLLISNGGIVQSSGFGVIGNLAGSVGAVIVTGADSLWANDGYTFVGNNGSGLLSIGDGGRVVNNDAVVGRLAGSDGTVTVEGNGSSWTNNGGLTIGNLSTGEMTIDDGGKVTNSDGFIGRFDGATGSVYVTGADSTWSNSGDLSIGKAGHGELTISDSGTVSANSVYLGGENTGQAVLNIGSQAGDIASAPGRLEANSVVLSETGTSHLVFNHNDLTGDYDFSAVISGGGSPDSSVDVLNGNTVMTGVGSDYAAPTNIEGGILSAGGSSVFSARSDYTVSPAGGLDLRGYDQSIASLINDGSVDFGGTGGTTLHVIGNYSGNGAVTINSVLGGDDSKTDLLQVDGDTSGATKLNVINRDGTGASTVNGIKVVDVGGNSEGSFALGNGYTTKDGLQAVVGGAYAYTLQRGDAQGGNANDWYLVSQAPDPVQPVDPTCEQTNSCPPPPPVDPTCEQTDSCPPSPPSPPSPRYSAGAPVYEGYVQNMLTLNKLPSLQQRVGNRYLAGSNGNSGALGATVDQHGVWARVEGSHNRLEPSTSTARMKQDINTVQMQAGVDGQFYENDKGRLIAGLTGQYGHAKGDISSLYGDGSIATDAWSLGATATWYGNDGFYLDGQGQVTWFENDLDSWTANTSLANGRKATGYALSAEAGQRVAIGGNWSLTPQAQLAWSSISADAFRDVWNARVSVEDGSSLLGRLGLAAEYATLWKDAQGRSTNANVYGIANLYQEFLGGTKVNLAGVDFDTDNDRTWAGIGAGGTLAWADNKYAVFGEGSINTGLNHFTQSYSLKANVGFKVTW